MDRMICLQICRQIQKLCVNLSTNPLFLSTCAGIFVDKDKEFEPKPSVIEQDQELTIYDRGQLRDFLRIIASFKYSNATSSDSNLMRAPKRTISSNV